MRRTALTLSAVVGLLAPALGPGLAPAHAGDGIPVPDGIHQVIVTLFSQTGLPGASEPDGGAGGAGGTGVVVRVALPVVPGQLFRGSFGDVALRGGPAGAGTSNNAGSGGAGAAYELDLDRDGELERDDQVIVLGGGGGGGAAPAAGAGAGGAGGAAGVPSTGPAARGALAAGGDGSPGGSNAGDPGRGGGAAAGAGGTSPVESMRGTAGTAGAGGPGGNGGAGSRPGGGGGGGRTGGGGGSAALAGAGGGGGSSWVSPLGIVLSASVSTGGGGGMTQGIPDPVTTLVTVPPSGSTSTSAGFSWTARADGEPSTTRTQCRLDGGQWTACTSPSTFQVDPGDHRFAVRALDRFGYAGEPDTHDWTVRAPNSPPVAVDDTGKYSYDRDGTDKTPTGNVLANDSDPDGDVLSARVDPARPADHGSVTLDPDGTWHYTPRTDGYSGPARFGYLVVDGNGGTGSGTVTLTRSLLVEPDSYRTVSRRTLTVTAGSGLLVNDQRADGTSLTALLADPPSHGEVEVEPDGAFRYTPDAGFTGGDVFTYRAQSDGGETGTGVVEVDVAANRAPTPVDDTATYQGTGTATGNVLDNDSDPDGDALRVSGFAGVVPRHHRSVTLTVGGSEPGRFVYQPTPGYSGKDSFGYRVVDPSGDTAIAVVHVDGGNLAPTAHDDDYRARVSEALTVPTGEGVLADDCDDQDGALAADCTARSGAPGGDLTATLVDGPDDGSLELRPDGSFTYTPGGLPGQRTFTYRVTDTDEGSDTATVTVDVTAPAPPPAPTVPSAPLDVAAAAAGTTALRVTWSPPASTGGTPVTGYRATAYDAGGTPRAVVDSGAADRTATLSGLAAGTAYTVGVVAVNAVGSGPEGRDTASTDTASSPRALVPAAVTLDVSARSVTAGNRPRAGGRVTDAQGRGVPGVEVVLQEAVYGGGGRYTEVARVTTGDDGTWSVLVSPTTRRVYGATVAVPGAAALHPVRGVLVEVNARMGLTAPAATPLPGATAVGRRLEVTGTLLPGYAGRPVGIAEWVGDRFVVLTQGRTDASGAYRVPVELTPGRHALVAFVSAHAGTGRGSTSQTVEAS